MRTGPRAAPDAPARSRPARCRTGRLRLPSPDNGAQAEMRNSLLEVTPVIPGNLARLPELAANLFFSWHRPSRALFEDLDPELWKQSGGNPRLLLRCVSQANLDRVAQDPVYLARYSQALQSLDAYLSAASPSGDAPLVAYFCAEYGVH